MRQALRLHPDSRCVAATRIEVDVTRPRAGSLVLSYVVHRQDRRAAPAAGDGAGARAMSSGGIPASRPSSRFAGRRLLRIQLRALDPMGGLSVRRLPQRDARRDRDRRAADRGAIDRRALHLAGLAGVGRAVGPAARGRMASRSRGGDRGNGRRTSRTGPWRIRPARRISIMPIALRMTCPSARPLLRNWHSSPRHHRA